ncbi:ArsR/SmtB family transcription factor [Treponema endosymbiont of Eucomonympha sp.]|uniref:ArsR/SmtB family transcription factor n=1 Tax=Treponema endosymbiont of Eucomonympha sp. TaxID=1580831 RepID=UPI000750AABB
MKNPAVCDCDSIHEDIVDKVRKIMPDERVFSNLAGLFKTFSDSTRVKILWLLHNEELCVCDLAALLILSKSAVSHKLKDLRLANLVDYRKEGRVVFYFLSNNHVKKIVKESFEHFTL